MGILLFWLTNLYFFYSFSAGARGPQIGVIVGVLYLMFVFPFNPGRCENHDPRWRPTYFY